MSIIKFKNLIISLKISLNKICIYNYYISYLKYDLLNVKIIYIINII